MVVGLELAHRTVAVSRPERLTLFAEPLVDHALALGRKGLNGELEVDVVRRLHLDERAPVVLQLAQSGVS